MLLGSIKALLCGHAENGQLLTCALVKPCQMVTLKVVVHTCQSYYVRARNTVNNFGLATCNNSKQSEFIHT